MQFRCKNAYPIGTTILKDYKLIYKGGDDEFAYLTLEPSKGSHVPLGIFKMSFYDEAALDKYEEYPNFYYKKYIQLNINNKKKRD